VDLVTSIGEIERLVVRRMRLINKKGDEKS